MNRPVGDSGDQAGTEEDTFMELGPKIPKSGIAGKLWVWENECIGMSKERWKSQRTLGSKAGFRLGNIGRIQCNTAVALWIRID